MSRFPMQNVKHQNLWSILKDYSFDFSSLPTTLKCIICKEILINPKQTSCGCRCCKECLTIHLSNNNCEDCKEISEINFPDDHFANREISELIVKCPFRLCTFKSMLREISDHIDSCRFKICPDEENFQECESRVIICEYCDMEFDSETIPLSHYDFKNTDLCVNYKAACPYKCEVSDKLILRNHLRVCSNRPLICPYFEMGGCIDQNILPTLMDEHLCKNGFKHTTVLLEMITNLGNEIKTTHQELRAKTLELTRCQKQLTELEHELKKAHLNSSYDTSQERPGAQMNSSNELAHVQSILDQHEMSLFSIQSRIEQFDMKFERKTTEYIWKLDNFTKIVDDAGLNPDKRLVYSRPFFAARNGHRLRLVFGPFEGQLGHMSLSFQLMRSRLDAVLCWPFQYDVSLALLDQSGNGLVHKQVYLFYDPSDGEQARMYSRPVGPTEYNDHYGVQNFLTLNSIEMSPNLLRDDSVIFRFTCKPICLSE